MSPDYKKYNPNSYGLNPGALFQLQPTPYEGNCDWTRASTGHTGGIQVTLADGHVRTVAQGVSYATWWFAFTPNGGEVLPSDW
jgi:prepilin-type processing-associated H-X9-DG protein